MKVMKRYSKIIRLFVYMVFVFGVFVVMSNEGAGMVQAADVSGRFDTTDVTWELKDGVLTISGGDLSFWFNGSNCYGYWDDGELGFLWPWREYASKINDVKITGKLTGIKSMYRMFYRFGNVKELDLSNIDTSSVWSMEELFALSNIERINFDGFDTSNVSNMSDMFKYCWQLENIDVSGFDTSNVRDMSGMFDYCYIENLDVSNFDTSNVTDMSCMFACCHDLKNIDMTSWDTSNVRNMRYMFEDCKYFNWDISGFDTSNVTDMTLMFASSGVSSVDISMWDMSKVTTVVGMFQMCTDLNTIKLPFVETSCLVNMERMFWQCPNLNRVNLSMWNLSNTDNLDDVFNGCFALEKVDFGSNDLKRCRNYENAFYNCKSLTILDLGGLYTYAAINMTGMFGECSKLQHIYVSDKWNTDNLEESDDMFSGCSNLVGGNGTVYDENHIDGEYARIDRQDSPGYLTEVISNIEITDLTQPAAGESFDKDITVNLKSCELTDAGIKYYDGSEEWDDKALYNKEYTVKITVGAKKDYIFSYNVTASVNGNNASVSSNPDGTWTVSYTFARTENKKNLEVNINDKTIVYGDLSFVDGVVDISSLGLFEDINSDGDKSYSVVAPISNGGAAEYDGTGRLTVKRAGKFIITLKTEESLAYNSGEKTAILTVNKGKGAGTVAINDIKEGEKVAPSASSSTNEPSGVVYEYSNSEAGTFTTTVPNTPGTYYVRAVFPANDLYEECVSSPVKFEIKSGGFVLTTQQEMKNVLDLNAGLKIDQKGSQINVTWGKVADADTYEVYLSYCGKVFRTKPDVTTSKTSAKLTKVNGKKLNLKQNFKLYVVSYKTIDGGKIALGKTMTGHIVGRKNKKYTNAKNIKVNKSGVSLSVGGKYKIKAKTILVDKKKKQLTNAHAKEFRYSTSDSSIANVDDKGRIYGVGKGTCYVYVYSRNGYSKKIEVKVE